MITVMYFLLLLAASSEDYRTHTVSARWTWLMWILGLINIVLVKENRWVTITLTCLSFLTLWLIYVLVRKAAVCRKTVWEFGGADVRLIPAMMLAQGWEEALTGVFAGLCLSVLCSVFRRSNRRRIPLVPWMTAGCFLVEITYLFSGKSVI